jgi:TonB family protein
VTGTSGSTSGGSLDLSQLDKALAGGTTSKGGSATGSGAGGAAGGSGTGSSAGAGSGNGQGYSLNWGGGGSGNGRTVLFKATPKLPAWVSKQGLTLTVKVSFTLLSEGLIGGVSLQQSSGYADVDQAVVEAIRRWLFTTSVGAPPATGQISYIIKPQ